MEEWYHWCTIVVVSGKRGKPPIPWFVKWADGGLGLSIFMLFQDTLHACDLGVSSHVIANVLVYMVESDMLGTPGMNKEAKLSQLWREMQALYKEHGVSSQIGNINMSMVCPKPMTDYPELTSHIKGAQTRCLAPIVCELFAMHGRFLPSKADYSVMDHEVWLVIKGLATFYEVIMTNMNNDKWQYCEHDIEVIQESVTTMMVMYKKLSFRYMFGDGPAWVAGVGPRWKWSIKHHHVLHIPEEAMLQCIHLSWCYMNEGFVGVMKKIGESCRYSFKAAHRSATICRKWAMGTCIMLMFAMQDKSGECMLGRHGVAVLRAEDSREVHEDDEGEEFFGFGFDDMHLG